MAETPEKQNIDFPRGILPITPRKGGRPPLPLFFTEPLVQGSTEFKDCLSSCRNVPVDLYWERPGSAKSFGVTNIVKNI